MSEIVDKLLKVSNMEDNFFEAINIGIKTEFSKRPDNFTSNDVKLLNEFIKNVIFPKAINGYKEMMNDLYSDDELKGLVDFYSSDVGQSYVKKSKIALREVHRIMQDTLESIDIDELEKFIEINS